ncbi:MAG: DUF4390 domain-containing protein [Desulfobacterales bacterium]|jgi:hypothetical protein
MNRKALSILLIVLFLPHQPVFAQDARLADINVSNTRDDLLMYLTLQGAFREKLKKAILSGVPATFSYYISLYRVRSVWFDKKVTHIKLTHSIKYDSLKKEFNIKRSWKKNNPVITQSFVEAQKLMTKIDSLKIYPLNGLTKGRQYQIRAKAEVSKLTLPFYLHYFLFSLWDFETDWYTIDFIF